MKLFLVTNNDGVTLGVFRKKKKAVKLKQLGKKRWHEKWSIIPLKTDTVEPWVTAGGEDYREHKGRA